MTSQNTAKLLSIVIPVYNGARFVDECLESVRAALKVATGVKSDVEIILCDNHSTDRTLALAEAFKTDITYTVIQPPTHYENRTLNWNYALSSASGTWQMMLHVDDLLHPSALKEFLPVLSEERDSTAVLIWGQHRMFDISAQASNAIPCYKHKSWFRGVGRLRKLVAISTTFHPFTIMRAETFRRIGGLDASYELAQDWDLWARMLACGDVLYVPRELAKWRLHDWSPEYKQTIALENVRFAARLRCIWPEFEQDDQRLAIRIHLAWAKHYIPGLKLSQALSKVDDDCRALVSSEWSHTSDIYRRTFWWRLRVMGAIARTLGSLSYSRRKHADS